MAWRPELLHVFLAADDAARAEMVGLAAVVGRTLSFIDDAGDDASARALERELREVEILVCGRPPQIDWSGATRLRLIHFLGAGIDGFFPARALAGDVLVANARGIHAGAIRDHVLSMLLAFARDLPRVLADQFEARWEPFAPGSIEGRTLGLIGLGEVGRPIATAAAALGMRVVAMRRDPSRRRPVPGVAEILDEDGLGTLLERADYVVVAIPLTPRTRGMLGPSALARMRATAVLINVARGGIVDEDALASALASGRLRGAALDVFATEPLPQDSPLWKAPNLIVTPHIAGWMPDYFTRACGVVLDNVARLERGDPLTTLVDRTHEY